MPDRVDEVALTTACPKFACPKFYDLVVVQDDRVVESGRFHTACVRHSGHFHLCVFFFLTDGLLREVLLRIFPGESLASARHFGF